MRGHDPQKYPLVYISTIGSMCVCVILVENKLANAKKNINIPRDDDNNDK